MWEAACVLRCTHELFAFRVTVWARFVIYLGATLSTDPFAHITLYHLFSLPDIEFYPKIHRNDNHDGIERGHERDQADHKKQQACN